jgi:CRP/FNR family transcriptional regulator
VHVDELLPRDGRPGLHTLGEPFADRLPRLVPASVLAKRPVEIAWHSPDVRCSSCGLRECCLPGGLTREELKLIDNRLVTVRRRVAHGDSLFHAGDRFDAVFEIWTGFFKTVVTTTQGREQVTGFQMGGELLGLDGIDTGRYAVNAIALEDSQVCVIPYQDLETLGREVPSLQKRFHKLMSREIVNDHGVMLHLASMQAEERVAAFLINLTDRLGARGFSASSLVLRMSREEIGSFLGLKLETVSRTFSKFQASGLLFVRQRQIQIIDPVGLKHLLQDAIVSRPVAGAGKLR